MTDRRLIGKSGALALLVVVLLMSTSCRSRIDLPAASTAPTGPPTAASIPTPVPSPTPIPTPRSAPTVEADPAPTAGPISAELDRPPNFESPDGWGDELAIDPAIIEGTLDNGLRYLVRENRAPGQQAQLRLVVQAGSVHEQPGDEGAAHFLEHMMFNGTERFPGNEIVTVLEGFGSGFGPDVNAYTSYEETVYELQVPTRTAAPLQLGLEVLHQWATAATIEPDAVIAERGVVREEHRRSTEGLKGRLWQAVREVIFAGTDYVGRAPIGSAEVIENMTASQLRQFYQRWYRPELMTVIAVGDFDGPSVVDQIAATFSSPASATEAEPLPPDMTPPELPEAVYDVVVDPELGSVEVEVMWRFADRAPRTRLQMRHRLVADLTSALLDARMFAVVQQGDTALFGSRVGSGPLTSAHQLFTMSGQVDADQVGTGLRDLLMETERARQHGFGVSEFEVAVAKLRVTIEQTLAEASTTQDSTHASDLVRYSLIGEIPLEAQERSKAMMEIVDSITIDDVRRHLFDVLATDPYVLVTGPSDQADVLPEPEQLAEIYGSTVGFEVDPRQQLDAKIFELMARPEPAEIVEDRRLGGLDTRVVTFDNGAQLALRQTTITENFVQLRAVSRGGFFAVEGADLDLLPWAPSLVDGSGFESVDVVALDRLLSGEVVSLSSDIGRAEERLNGDGATDDLEVLLQLVHLQMTEPVITDIQIRQFDESLRPLVENPLSAPRLASDLELWRLRYGDSPWFRLLPTKAELDSLDADRVLSAYKDRFADAGDFVFVIVGDFDPETVIDLGARYLGTLPDSGRREGQIDRDPGIPPANLVETVRAGIGDQGRVRINWESAYPFDVEAEVAALALDLVVNARLRDLIREELGASYAPNATVSLLSEPKPWVDTIIEVDSDPERVDEVAKVIREELDRIRAGDFDERYLDLAVEQLTEDFRFFSNKDWIDLIAFHILNPERATDEYRRRRAIAEALTPEAIVAAAVTVFPPERSVEVRLLPAVN